MEDKKFYILLVKMPMSEKYGVDFNEKIDEGKETKEEKDKGAEYVKEIKKKFNKIKDEQPQFRDDYLNKLESFLVKSRVDPAQIPENKFLNILNKANNMNELGIDSETSINYALNGVEISDSSFDIVKDSINLRYRNGETENNLDAKFIIDDIFKKIDKGENPILIVDSLDDGSFLLKVKLSPKSVLMSNDFRPLDVKDGILEFMCDESFLDMIEIRYQENFEWAIDDYEDNGGVISSYQLSSEDKNDDVHKKFISFYNFRQLRNRGKTLDGDYNEERLQIYFNTVVYKTGRKVDTIDENILKELEERNRRLREFIDKNKGNNKLQSKDNNDTEDKNKKTEVKTINLQTASGEEIAKDAGLGKELSKQYKNESILEDSQFDEKAFSEARDNFSPDSDLKKCFKKDTISNFYNKNGDTFTIKDLKDSVRDELNELGLKDKAKDELSRFLDKVNNIKEILIKNSKFAEAVKNEENNNKAIGSIIDDVRSIFSKKQENDEGNISIGKGLELKNQNPVKIEGDNLIISGEFDGVDVTVRYNLKTGDLFMNSFLQHNTDLSKITLGNNLQANEYVGKLAPFDNILSNKELLDSQVQSLIVEKSKKQSAVNSVIMKFMKTFNVIPASGEFDKLDFNKGSNLFDVIKIIEETGNPDTGNLKSLEYFNNDFMPTIMKYSGLEWGKRNENQNKNTDESQGLLSYEGDDKMINSLKNEVSNFIPRQFEGIANFDGSNQLGFVNFIKDNIIEGEGPNSQLSLTKMENFENTLKSTNYDDELLTRALSNA